MSYRVHRFLCVLATVYETSKNDIFNFLQSIGTRQGAINVAEGTKQSVILASEAVQAEQINKASGKRRVECEKDLKV